MNQDFYLEFENKFRGDRSSIVEKFSCYDKLIELTIENIDVPKFIDIGCGRGEWLEKWKNKVPDSLGIECDPAMADLCRTRGLNIIQGDAIESLKKISKNSIDVITIFHLIEHLEHGKIIKLLSECYRVLNDSGLLILETPSIDNILVSTKNFYIDPTHINHINPTGFEFAIESIGFTNVAHYYINPGPLNNSSHLKLTRILNGVAQDVLFLATKSNILDNHIFHKNANWISGFDVGKTTLDAAIEFDLRHEAILNNLQENLLGNQERNKLLDDLNQDIILLKRQFGVIFLILNLLKKFFIPLKIILKFFTKCSFYILNKILNIILKLKFIRRVIQSRTMYNVIYFISRSFFLDQLKLKFEKIVMKSKKFDLFDASESKLSNKLINHYNNSKGARKISKLFDKKSRKK